MNVAILLGCLQASPKLSYASSGKAYATAKLELEKGLVEVDFQGSMALEVSSLKPGDRILIEGFLFEDNWQDAKGDSFSKIKIRCEKLKIIDAEIGEVKINL